MSKENQVLIKLQDLEPSPLNSFDINEIEDMVGSLKSLGLITPLSVIGPMDNGKYQILSGERRYQAIKEIAAEESYNGSFDLVPCYIVGSKDMDEYEQKLIIESANLETREYDKDEHRFKIIGILKEMEQQGKIEHKNIIDEMGKYMNGSDRYRRMYRTVFERGIEETKDLVKDKILQIHEASRIASLPEETQKVAVEAINEGVPKKDVLDTIARTNAEKKEILKEEKEKVLINMGEMGEIKRANEGYEEAQDGDFANNDDSLFSINDDEEFIRRVKSGDYQREELGRLLEETNRKDLIQDSTGRTQALMSERGSSKGDKSLDYITKWISIMTKKKRFTEEEMEVFESLRDLLNYVDEVIVMGEE